MCTVIASSAWLGTKCRSLGTKYLHNFLASSPLRFGLCIQKGSIFWVGRPLSEESTKEQEEHHLDMPEKFGLAKEIISFHGIGNLRRGSRDGDDW